jgi:3-oxoacyl-[acyl-carrier protein] reductase
MDVERQHGNAVLSLAGQRAIVTGASRGIGAATAVLLADAGAAVLIGYRHRQADAERVAAECAARGVRSFPHQADLSTSQGNLSLFDRAAELFGGVDIFVGNSGLWPDTPLAVAELDDARWRQTLALNLDGVFLGCRLAARRMGPGGRIVLVSSTAGQRGEAFHADYAASKGALIAFVKSLAVELAPRDITVNTVAPGWVDTEAVARPFAGGGRARIEGAIPLGRVAAPRDIAGPIVFLCSPLARHVTGEVLNVNGGSVLCG